MKRFIALILYRAWKTPAKFRTGAVLLLLLSAILVLTADFSADIAGIFPEGGQSAKLFRSMTKTKNGSEKAVVFFSKNGENASRDELRKFMVSVSERAKTIPGITGCRAKAFDLPPAAMTEALVQEIPSVLPPSAFPSGKNLEAKCRAFYRQLVLTGTGRTEMLRTDPLNLTLPLLKKLQQFRTLSGIAVNPADGYLFAPDGSHAMMILSADLRLSDSKGIRKMLSGLLPILKECPAGYRYELLSPLLHSVANEDAMKRDLTLLGILSLIIFPLLFLIVYKGDFKSLILPAVPFLAMIPACAVLRLIFGEILLFTVGIGGIVAGLGVDYGIHLYAASAGGIRRMMRIVPSLIPALVTSLLAFCVFLLSGAEAFLQFGLFAAVTLFFSFLFYIALMPGIFLSRKITKQKQYMLWKRPELNWTLWGIAMLLFLFGTARLEFDGDFRSFDIGQKQYAAATAEFNKAFRTAPSPGMILFPSYAEMEQAMPRLRNIEGTEYFSFTDLTGTEDFRSANRALWRKCLPEKRAEMEKAMSNFGIEKEFFKPFFQALERGSAGIYGQCPLYKPLQEFADRKGSCILLFSDTDGTAGKIADAVSFPVLSEKYTSRMMTHEILRTLTPVGFAALVLVIFVILAEFRKTPSRIFASLLPLTAAFLATCGICGLTGKSADLSTLISGIIVAGISVDYGIIMAKKSGIPESALCGALTFSAVTSAAGGLTVLFAEHRMLSSAGMTIIAGILAAWGTGVFIVPLVLKNGKFIKKAAVLLLLPLLLTGCLSEPFEYRNNGPVRSELNQYRVPAFTMEGSAVLDWRLGKITFLVTAAMEKDGSFRIAGLNPAGALLFTVSENGNIQWLMPDVSKEKGIFAAEKVRNALPRIFCFTRNEENNRFSEGRLETRVGNGWKVRYALWKKTGSTVYPAEAIYDESGIRLALRVIRYGELQ